MNEHEKARIIRYLTDECSKEEARKTIEWCHNNPEREQYLKEVSQIWDASHDSERSNLEKSDVEPGDADLAWLTLSEKIDAEEKQKQKYNNRKHADSTSRSSHSRKQTNRFSRSMRTRETSFLRRRLVWGIAMLLLVGGGVWFGVYMSSPAVSGEDRELLQDIVTERGEQTQVHLPDGSQVMLSADTRLSLASDFEEGKRLVHLDGEAYFEVASGDNPFTIRTEEGQIEVYGTAFNVRSYQSEAAMQVAVREGEVSMRSEQQNGDYALLGAGHIGHLENDQLTTERDANVEPYLGWTEGRFTFDGWTLPKVVTELERWYDIDIIVDDPELESKRLTANLDRGQPLSDILKSVAASLGIEYEIGEDQVVLTN